MDSSENPPQLKCARKRSRSRAGAASPAIIVKEPKVMQQRVYLYMQLHDIINLPVVSYPLELHLYHTKNTLQKLSEHYTTETIIYETEFKMTRPVFAMSIWQDNLEDLNVFSDNPLVVSLYQRIPRHRRCDLKMVKDVRTEASGTTLIGVTDESVQPLKDTSPRILDMSLDVLAITPTHSECLGEDEEYEEETVEFISRGHCDLLQLFQRKRFISNISIMLYPEYNRKLQTTTSQKIATTTQWHMYSIIPMLKNLNFCNLAFFTLESIYNSPPSWHTRAGHLGISVSIRSTRPNLYNEYVTLPLCTFYGFNSQIISEQNTTIVWENMKRDLLGGEAPINMRTNQMQTSARIKLPHLFRNLLTPPGVNLKLDAIDLLNDRALINNSQHRYVLTEEMREIIEAAVQHSEYAIMLQLYDEIPENILYEGVINPSIFGYPNVNSCRFACTFSPVSSKNRKSIRVGSKINPDMPIFAILKICFFQPLTQFNDSLDTYNETALKSARLRRCTDVGCLHDAIPTGDIIKELYRRFDDLIRELIGFIVKNEVTDVNEYRGAFCCHLGNLRNLLVDICAVDFNVKTPTKTNIEFREMLTHMHKELMERIEDLVTCCAWDSQTNCIDNLETEGMQTRRLMEEYRYMCLVGECTLAKYMFNEINAASSNQLLFHFYVFLHSVENLNFDVAAKYVLKEMDNNWHGTFFVSLLKLYIDYQLELQNEEDEGEAFSNMMEQLRQFAAHNNLDREVWILLYCYYKQSKYVHGMEYTRWKYENLYKIPEKVTPPIPRSLYTCFMLIELEPSALTMHSGKFYTAFKAFAQLGAYGFAQVIFNEIAGEFKAIEIYLVSTTLLMLQGKIDDSFQLRTLPSDNSERGKLLNYYQFHINGNVEYTRRRYDSAISYFKNLLTLTAEDTDMLPHFYISLLRLGRLSFDMENYEQALQAYELCVACTKNQRNFLANYGMGLTLYYQGQLQEALKYISLTTDNEVYMADPWGYLALINLRLQHNKTALECWKIAKMYPETPLNNRIYAELDKVSYSNICLLVDDECKPLPRETTATIDKSNITEKV